MGRKGEEEKGEEEKGEKEKGEREKGEEMKGEGDVQMGEAVKVVEKNIDLAFQNTPLHTAIDLIKTRYGIDIIINSNELNEILLNVSFDNNDSVEYVLEIIAATVSARLEKQGNQYIIISHD